MVGSLPAYHLRNQGGALAVNLFGDRFVKLSHCCQVHTGHPCMAHLSLHFSLWDLFYGGNIWVQKESEGFLPQLSHFGQVNLTSAKEVHHPYEQ